MVRNLPVNSGDSSSTPRSRISPGEGNGSPLQYSCLGNPMDREFWWATIHRVAKSRTWLSDCHFHFTDWPSTSAALQCHPWHKSSVHRCGCVSGLCILFFCPCKIPSVVFTLSLILDIWAGKIPWRKKWQPIPVLLPGKSHWQRSLVGYSPWGHKRVRDDLATKRQQNGGGSSHRGKGFRIQSPWPWVNSTLINESVIKS